MLFAGSERRADDSRSEDSSGGQVRGRMDTKGVVVQRLGSVGL